MIFLSIYIVGFVISGIVLDGFNPGTEFWRLAAVAAVWPLAVFAILVAHCLQYVGVIK